MYPSRLLSRRVRFGLWAGFSLLYLSLLLLLIGTEGLAGDFLDFDVAYYLAMATATILCVSRAAIIRENRTLWTLMSLVVLSSMLGDLIWDLTEDSFPSTADGFWIASYLLLFAALATLIAPMIRLRRWTFLLDWVIVTCTIAAVATLLFLHPLIDSLPDGSDTFAVLVYPVGDILALAAIAAILGTGATRHSPAMTLFAFAGFVWMLGDAVYGYRIAVGTYNEGELLDLTWPLAVGIIATAAWAPEGEGSDQLTAQRRAVFLSSVCVLVSLATVLGHDLFYEHHNSATFYLATIAVAGGGVRLFYAQSENQRLLAAVNTDHLTGIPSRAKLVGDIATLNGRPSTVMIFDLDGFKFYNDRFGHPAGDDVLRHLARRLVEAVDDKGEVYRIGGDEFCVLLPGEEADAQTLRELAEASHIVGEEFEIEASFGSASYPGEGTDMDLVLGLADQRMYVRKRSSKTSARSQVHEALIRSLREREPKLADHTSRVLRLSRVVAERLVSDRESRDVIERAAQLHDIGKVAIPDAILDKPGALNDAEWELMKQHTLIGERIISESPALAPVGRLVRNSHEWWNGKGYPDGLSGEDIPLGSRVIIACDAVDAMLDTRAYSSSLSVDEVVQELRRCSGSQFDPRVAEILVEILLSDSEEDLSLL